ncbi:AAA family ATPase [Actinopolymorpha sp. B9G3]|uniref:AAA family ATPase n=1 Tax=Actinopolymorpha sp. B9G3 TaxID=3158970 RepID=UPI0032D91010
MTEPTPLRIVPHGRTQRRPASPPKERRTRWTADELLAVNFPEPRWAIPGLIAEGVSLLAGPPKVRKSWLGLGWALAVASGGKAFDSIPVEEGDVLYLALEDTGRRLQDRTIKLLGGQRPPRRLRLDITWPALPEGGDVQIADWLDDHPQARLVIIDTFAKVRGRPIPGMSAYEADYAAIARIKRVADHYGVAVVLVHHTRKAAAEDFLSEVSGTNGLAGAADATLVLKRPRGSADGILHVTGRDITESDYALALHEASGAWHLLDGPPEEHTVHQTRASILRYIRQNPGATPKTIAEATGLNANTVRQTCSRMAKDDQLHALPGGAYHPASTSDSTDTEQLSQLSLRHPTPPDQGEHE